MRIKELPSVVDFKIRNILFRHIHAPNTTTFLTAYPRSGSSWFRYCVEFLTKRPTVGLGRRGNTVFSHPRDTGVDEKARPILHKNHLILADNGQGYYFSDYRAKMEKFSKNRAHRDNRSENKLILLLRNYKECIPRHNSPTGKCDFDTFLQQTSGQRQSFPPPDYIGPLLCFEEWEGPRLLIYYRDFIREPMRELANVLDFLGCDHLFLPELARNFEVHRQKSLQYYNRFGQNAQAHISRTGGDKNKLDFHSRRMDQKERMRWDQSLKTRYPGIFAKYLACFEEK